MELEYAKWVVTEETPEGPRVVEAYTDAEIAALDACSERLAGACIELATLPPNAQLDIRALARIYKKSTKSIQRAIRRGDLPKPFRFMGKCVWLASVIIDHIAAMQKAALQLDQRRKDRLCKHGA